MSPGPISLILALDASAREVATSLYDRALREGATHSRSLCWRTEATMLQSSAKRRKTSEDTSIPVTDQNTNINTNATPTTPTRASYLSPTKASLARSHPHLVSNKNGRALTEPRGRLLRNELLRNKDQSAPQTEKSQHTSTEEWKENATAPRPVARLQATTEVKSSASAATKPPRPQALAQTRASKDSDSPEPVSPTIVPRLVKKSDPLTRAASRPRSNEPNLPPTPRATRSGPSARPTKRSLK